MVRRQLGRTGLAVAPIGLGTTKIGRNTDVKYPTGFALPSDEEVSQLFAAALGLGVNLIDTAPAYGESEERLGDLVRKHRSQIVLCTKAGESYSNGRSVHDFSAAAVTARVHASLFPLQTGPNQILLLHSDGRGDPILTQTAALAGLE